MLIRCLHTSVLLAVVATFWGACEAEPGPAEADADAVADAVEDVDAGFPQSLVRVATFNVERYFDDVCDSRRCEPGDFEEVPSPAVFAYRTGQIAGAIRGLEADVVLLQEVESQRCMDALVAELGDRFGVAVIGELGYAASMDVAVLARGELVDIVRHQDEPFPRPGGGTTRFTRELLELHLDVAGHRLIVLNAHFKSQYADDPDKRLAEARRARQIVDAVDAAHPDALVVFGGDLNDVPGSPPLNELEAGTRGLVRLGAQLPPEDDWTLLYRGNRQALDHLYLPVDDLGAYVDGTVSVVRGTAGYGYGGSDHAVMRAVLRLGGE